MKNTDSRVTSLVREAIDNFLLKRLAEKTEKLKDDDPTKKTLLEERHEPSAWMADAARRVVQLQLATHTLKPIHPDARGTNIYVDVLRDSPDSLVGTSALASSKQDDVVGNAAALDVYKFLSIDCDGETLLARLRRNDPASLAALSEDAKEATEWASAFASIARSDSHPMSDPLVRQLYFPIGEDEYHLIAPLYPTSLVHAVSDRINSDRFSEESKAARKACQEGTEHHSGYRSYPGLLIQNFGGTKPQNISQLNSKRRGRAPLLASLPPTWKLEKIHPPRWQTSVFLNRNGAYANRPRVRQTVRELVRYLHAVGETNNLAIRSHRASLVNELLDELYTFIAKLHTLPPGWSADEGCRLDPVEKRFFDPVHLDTNHEDDKPTELSEDFGEIAARFGRWLNDALMHIERKTHDASFTAPLGDDEERMWRVAALELLEGVVNS